MRVYQSSQCILKALLERLIVFGIDSAVILFERIKRTGYQQPFIPSGQRSLSLSQEETHCDVSLVKGYNVIF